MADTDPAAFDPAAMRRRHQRARAARTPWETHWQECYDYALPQRPGLGRFATPGESRADRLFDGTAADAVDQLAASLLAELTPPWSRWCALVPGPDVDEADRAALAEALEAASAALQFHFDRSNFSVEMHQAYLDLVTAGTASLLFEEAPPGERSAFAFTAVPLGQVALEEGPGGALDTTWRRTEMSADELRRRFPPQALDWLEAPTATSVRERRYAVVECVAPEAGGFAWRAMLEAGADAPTDRLLASGRFARSPFVNFRWLKAPGESYGRSPVMKALPDIKTANKVVELVLKNASIAVTGIWQADDDGVLNPATVRLVPGAIIPKAVGSSGLTPLDAPGRFDVSQLVLDDLRARIRHAMLADRLGQIDAPRMTATEVLERSAEMARVLGATYGRLQSELITPLALRALAILRRRGEVPDLAVDGRTVVLEPRSPLARAQAHRDVQPVMRWIEALAALGPEARAVADMAEVARGLGRALGVPDTMMRPAEPVSEPAAAAAPVVPGLDPSALLAGLTGGAGALPPAAAMPGGEAGDV